MRGLLQVEIFSALIFPLWNIYSFQGYFLPGFSFQGQFLPDIFSFVDIFLPGLFLSRDFLPGIIPFRDISFQGCLLPGPDETVSSVKSIFRFRFSGYVQRCQKLRSLFSSKIFHELHPGNFPKYMTIYEIYAKPFLRPHARLEQVFFLQQWACGFAFIGTWDRHGTF